MKKIYTRRLYSFIFVLMFLCAPMSSSAMEVEPFSTHIAYLGASLTTEGTCLLGSVSGAFTGSNTHAIYYSEFQYLSSYGEYTTAGDARTFRSYNMGPVETFEAYYCNPTPGVRYRFHTNMKVYDSNGNIKDSDVINSNTLVY